MTIKEAVTRPLGVKSKRSESRWVQRKFWERRRWETTPVGAKRARRNRETVQECGWVNEWAENGSEGCWVCRGVFSQTSRCPLCLTPFYDSFTALAYCSRPDSLLLGSCFPRQPPAPSLEQGHLAFNTVALSISPTPDSPLIHTRSDMSPLPPSYSNIALSKASKWHTLSHRLIHQGSGQ